jgi:Heterokaryon incompatibility protein (HET)
MPARVVDIGDGNEKSKILETQGKLQGPYVALSYAWGDAEDAMLKLKTTTRDDLLKEINLSQLILSHQHGIQVARELGYRYIWIDALCAIQDDKADWIGQAKLVAQIYGNADLTIVAGRSKDARDGFLPPAYTPSAPPAALHYQPASLPQLSRCWVSLPRSNEIGYLSGRGWCFQEALVSRRQIIYGEEQLSFHCREEIKFEGGHFENIGQVDAWYDLTTLFHHRYQPQRLPEIPRYARDDPVLERWYAMTSEYSSRGFYHASENHVALSSTVRLFQEALVARDGVGSDRYMAGLWERDMLHGLLWKGRRIEDNAAPALETPAERRGPSWSWMALIGPICYTSVLGKFSGLLREPCCTPAHHDGKTWASEPDGWGPDMIDSELFPHPFSLEVNAYIRRVRMSRYNTRDLPAIPLIGKFQYEIANPITFCLEAADDGIAPLISPVASDIAARGLFDVEDATANRPMNMWAMSVIGSEGLLLRMIPNTSNAFERLGVFYVEELTAFYPPEAVIEDTGARGYLKNLKRPKLIMENLPMEKIVLI